MLISKRKSIMGLIVLVYLYMPSLFAASLTPAQANSQSIANKLAQDSPNAPPPKTMTSDEFLSNVKARSADTFKNAANQYKADNPPPSPPGTNPSPPPPNSNSQTSNSLTSDTDTPPAVGESSSPYYLQMKKNQNNQNTESPPSSSGGFNPYGTGNN